VIPDILRPIAAVIPKFFAMLLPVLAVLIAPILTVISSLVDVVPPLVLVLLPVVARLLTILRSLIPSVAPVIDPLLPLIVAVLGTLVPTRALLGARWTFAGARTVADSSWAAWPVSNPPGRQLRRTVSAGECASERTASRGTSGNTEEVSDIPLAGPITCALSGSRAIARTRAGAIASAGTCTGAIGASRTGG
jgi:hypothetical protein